MPEIVLDGIAFERAATAEWVGTRDDGTLLWPDQEWTLAALDEIEALRRRLTPPRTPITERQAAVLSFIRERLHARGVVPTCKEIAEHFGFRSLASVASHIEQLERRGYITRRPNEAQSITIIEVPGER